MHPADEAERLIAKLEGQRDQRPSGLASPAREMTPRRFPPPWTFIEHADSFWVQDAGGQTVG
jgi:hypothetical protein